MILCKLITMIQPREITLNFQHVVKVEMRKSLCINHLKNEFFSLLRFNIFYYSFIFSIDKNIRRLNRKDFMKINIKKV